jgi:hypothetical protein
VLLSELQPSITVAFHSDLDAASLWHIVSDPLTQPQFSSELQAVRLIGDGPIALGSQFEGDQRRGEREWTTISTVTTFDVERTFVWTVPSQDDGVTPVSTWTISLLPVGRGTRIGESVVLHGGPSPMTSHVTDHPETMFDVINERLLLLASNMMRSLRGMEQLALKGHWRLLLVGALRQRGGDTMKESAETASWCDHAINEAVGDRLLGRHEVVAVDIVHHLLDWFATVVRNDLAHPSREREHFA